ncbi:hypothetical protein [Halorussus aquaticus]|uniref:DUF3368 domain-containing protein n=1 Tax=Halorussus aquaticus TaxID=2953748 RepID=A0ABD5Q180_9EURY|nr:hypothetical protein [Halorussus aquaticus]
MILVDATTLISLGQIGELHLLQTFDRKIIIEGEVLDEVSTEPAQTNVSEFLDRDSVGLNRGRADLLDEEAERERKAKDLLGETDVNGDVRIIAGVLRTGQNDDRILVISDDKRVRTIADTLGATVTGTVGVIVRAVEVRDMTTEQGKELVRRVDSHGLHMTGELREKAYELVEDAAKRK